MMPIAGGRLGADGVASVHVLIITDVLEAQFQPRVCT